VLVEPGARPDRSFPRDSCYRFSEEDFLYCFTRTTGTKAILFLSHLVSCQPSCFCHAQFKEDGITGVLSRVQPAPLVHPPLYVSVEYQGPLAIQSLSKQSQSSSHSPSILPVITPFSHVTPHDHNLPLPIPFLLPPPPTASPFAAAAAVAV
jgi:hypothetical protein